MNAGMGAGGQRSLRTNLSKTSIKKAGYEVEAYRQLDTWFAETVAGPEKEGPGRLRTLPC